MLVAAGQLVEFDRRSVWNVQATSPASSRPCRSRKPLATVTRTRVAAGHFGAVGFEADHPRREKAEVSRQRRRDREVRQQRGLVGRLEPLERDQVVAEADADLRQRVDLADGSDGGDGRLRRGSGQRRDGRQRFALGRRSARKTTGREEGGGQRGEGCCAARMPVHVASIFVRAEVLLVGAHSEHRFRMTRRVAAALALVLGALAVANRPIGPRAFAGGANALVFEDRAGVALGTVLARDTEHAVRVPLAGVSPRFLAAIVAAEDARFAAHDGVDALALARAAWQLVRTRHVVSGGSTITMQLARLRFGLPRTPLGKLEELLLARCASRPGRRRPRSSKRT